MDRFCTQVSENTLLNAPGMQPLRKELLESALAYYRRFLDQRQRDPATRVEVARAYFRLGKIKGTIGSKEEAIVDLRQGRDLLEQLLLEDPDSFAIKKDLASSYHQVGYVELELGRLTEALQSTVHARDLLSELVSDPRATAETRHLLTKALGIIGTVTSKRGQLELALESYKDACRRADELAHDYPDVRDYRYSLGLYFLNLGDTYSKLGQADDALRCCAESRNILERLVQEDAASLQYRQLSRKVLFWNRCRTGAGATE